jgi:hypothetical protein
LCKIATSTQGHSLDPREPGGWGGAEGGQSPKAPYSSWLVPIVGSPAQKAIPTARTGAVLMRLSQRHLSKALGCIIFTHPPPALRRERTVWGRPVQVLTYQSEIFSGTPPCTLRPASLTPFPSPSTCTHFPEPTGWSWCCTPWMWWKLSP